jgi:hypothetical protein
MLPGLEDPFWHSAQSQKQAERLLREGNLWLRQGAPAGGIGKMHIVPFLGKAHK